MKRASVGYLYIGHSAREAGNPDQARKWFEKAEGIDLGLAAKPGALARSASDVAEDLYGLALVALDQDLPVKAADLLDQASEKMAGLLKAEPEKVEYLLYAEKISAAHGLALMGSNPSEALVWFTKALNSERNVLAVDPTNEAALRADVRDSLLTGNSSKLPDGRDQDLALAPNDLAAAAERLLTLAAAGNSAMVEARAPGLAKLATSAPAVRMQILMAWAWSRRDSGKCADIAELIGMIGAESNSRVDLLPLEWRSRSDPAARTLLGRTHSGSLSGSEALQRLREWGNCR